jgi:hypothetical protein
VRKAKKAEPVQNPIHFFCDKCGVEVPQDAKTCPGCGRSFSSVRCPACNFVGGADLFAVGCPVCGYSAGSASQPQTKTVSTGEAQAVEAASALPLRQRLRQWQQHASLPLWIYVVAIAALLMSAFSLYLKLRG